MSSPGYSEAPRVALNSSEFAKDPHRAYREMRARYGAIAPVTLARDVPATLVLDYHTALRILNDPEHFPADPRNWEPSMPPGCPVKPMMEWRPNSLRNSGAVHARYRQANLAALDGVDLHAVQNMIGMVATPLINNFCTTGKADLISQYAYPLAFQVMNALTGATPEIGRKVTDGVTALFEGIEAEQGNAMVTQALSELVALKRANPSDDITSRLLQHPAQLSDIEAVHQLVTLYGAGIEPELNLIGIAMLLLLSDDRFASNVLDGSLSTQDALDEVLFSDPPVTNYCMSYPVSPILIDDVWLPANQPVLISITGCNNDPAIEAGEHAGNRSHLAWGAGPHACPAKPAATLIAREAIDQLLDALPDLELAVPADQLTYRPGPFHRALDALPVVFPPTPPLPLPTV